MKKKEISGYRKIVAIKLKAVFVVYGILNMAGSQMVNHGTPQGQCRQGCRPVVFHTWNSAGCTSAHSGDKATSILCSLNRI